MLVAERNFEMQHFLAGTLEPEMARFNDASMHGADRHFMHLRAFHAEELAVGWRFAGSAPHGLEPRMPRRGEFVLLPNFALEQMCLRLCRGK